MIFAYKAKSKKQKKKTPSSRGKIVSRNSDSNITAYNDVRNFYRTPSNNSNNCLQRVKFINRYFDSEREDYMWSESFKQKVNEAIIRAIEQLNKALQDDLVKNTQSILLAIQDVIKVLQDQELEIFPLPQSVQYLGQAAQGYYQISINTNSTIYSLSKTLIHEAFHIIGGCRYETSFDMCNDDIPKENAFKDISRKRGIGTMSADKFAQFVMQC